MKNSPMHDRQNPSDVAFIVWAAIAAIGLIVVFHALGFAPGRDLALSIFAAP
jgi:hypothetical protein